MTHAALGASGSHRWMNCPGSIRMSEGMPDTTSPYAREGTAAHALAERALRKGLDADVWIGAEIEGVEVTEEMAEAVQVYVNEVRIARLPKWARHAFEIEARFSLEKLNPPGPMYGTADAVLWYPDDRFLHVFDYKHGQGVAVDATENSQLMYYALGAVIALGRRPTWIEVTIVQPHAAHPDGIVRSYGFTYETLVEFKNELFAAARRTIEEDAPLIAGEWCRFCPAQAVCPAQANHALAMAQSEFTAIEPPPPERLTERQLLAVLNATPVLREWLIAVQDYAKNQLRGGEEVEGWKLVPKRATRRWTDEESTLQWLEEEHPDADPYAPAKLRSPAQMEAELKRSVGKKVALPDDLVEKKSSGFNLAPDTDPRPAVSAVEEFEALPPASDQEDNEAASTGE